MFLIEFSKDEYIDGERINYIGLANKKVIFTIAGESENIYTVHKPIEQSFLSQVQLLSEGHTNLKWRHKHINNPDTKY